MASSLQSIDRCYSIEDLEFAVTSGSAAVFHLFLDERHRLAMQWIKRTKQEADRLRQPCVHGTRRASIAEFRLLTYVASFVLLYHAWTATSSLYGLLRTKTLLWCVVPLARVLGKLRAKISGSLIPEPSQD